MSIEYKLIVFDDMYLFTEQIELYKYFFLFKDAGETVIQLPQNQSGKYIFFGYIYIILKKMIFNLTK